MTTGQWITSPDGARWFFDSGSLALDFGYTGDYGYGVAEWEHLHTPADLADWVTERFGPFADTPTAADLIEAFALREAVTQLALALADARSADAAHIDTVNRFATAPPPVPYLDGGTTTAIPTEVSAALSAIARDAIATFDRPSRVRRCGGDNCALVFFDTSRPGTRRWCSMRRCGNRTKIRRSRAKRSTP